MVPLCSTTCRGEYRRIIPVNLGPANHSLTSRTVSSKELIIASHCPQLSCCHLADLILHDKNGNRSGTIEANIARTWIRFGSYPRSGLSVNPTQWPRL